VPSLLSTKSDVDVFTIYIFWRKLTSEFFGQIALSLAARVSFAEYLTTPPNETAWLCCARVHTLNVTFISENKMDGCPH
jgi:hypothetical protein